MVDAEIIRTVFGIIGNVISFGLLVLEVPTFYRILKNKSVNGVRPVYYLAAVINCLFWVFYGMPFIHPGNILVLTAYGIGLAIQLPYLIIILVYANTKKQRMYVGVFFLIELVVISLATGFAIRLAPTVERGRQLVDFNCLVSGLMVSFAEVFCITDTKSDEYLKIRIVWGKTLYAVCWNIYGWLKYDPNSLFWVIKMADFLCGLILLLLYYMDKQDAKSAAVKKLATAEVQVQGTGMCAGKKLPAIAGMGTGADKKLAIAEV